MEKVFIAVGVVGLALTVACGPRNPQERVAAGAEALARGNIPQALLMLEQAAHDLPGDCRAQNLHGLAQYEFGRLGDAQQAFHRAVEANPNDPAARFNLGVVAYVERDYSAAAEQLETCAGLAPRNATAWLFLGATYLSLNNFDSAYRATRTVIDLEPQNADALNNLAVIALKRGRARDAETWLKKALEASPNHPAAHLNLARLYELELKDKPKALEYYRRYAALEPNSTHRFAVVRSTRQLELDLNVPSIPLPAPAPPATPPPPATAAAPAATNAPATSVTLTAGQPKDLHAAALRIQIDQLTSARRNRDASEVALILADLYRQQNDTNRMSDAYARAVELDPLSPIAHFRLGEFLQEQGRKSAALQSFQEAVRLQPDFLAALRRSGALADELNQPAIAAPAYKRIIEVAPDERSAYLRLAEINEKHLKQRAAAEQLYQTFLNKFPTAPEVNLVRIRLGAKPAAAPRPAAPKAAQAKAAPARAEPAMAGAEPAPKPATPARPVEPYVDPATRYKNALGLLLSGNLDAAAPQFEILVRQDPNHANAHLSLGQIYSMKAETMPKARAHYTRFLQLRPDDPKAPEVRRWLERTR